MFSVYLRAKAAVLHDSRASGRLLYVNGGEEPIEQALENMLSGE